MTKPNPLDELAQRIDDVEGGLYRMAVGPGGIRGQQIKPRSVTAGLINVDNLQSVQSQTGNLSITGNLTMTTHGVFSAGQTAYNTGVGFWQEFNGGTPRLSLGNSGGNHLTWDGTNLTIVGAVTATTGTIGGWVIGSTDLTGSSGVIGLASSGSIRIWSGSATPSSAPFRVDSLGNMTAVNATLTSATISGSSTFSGSLSGATGSFSGSLSAATGTLGALTVNGTLTLGTGGISSAGMTVSSAGVLVATGATITGAINATSGSFSGSVTTGALTATGGTLGGLSVTGTLTVASASGGKLVINSNGTASSSLVMQYSGTPVGYLFGNSSAYWVWGETGYPLILTAGGSPAITLSYGTDFVNTNCKTLWVDGNASYPGIKFSNIANGGSASNWSSFSTANVIDKAAGYFKIAIGSTNYRVPFFADA